MLIPSTHFAHVNTGASHKQASAACNESSSIRKGAAIQLYSGADVHVIATALWTRQKLLAMLRLELLFRQYGTTPRTRTGSVCWINLDHLHGLTLCCMREALQERAKTDKLPIFLTPHSARRQVFLFSH